VTGGLPGHAGPARAPLRLRGRPTRVPWRTLVTAWGRVCAQSRFVQSGLRCLRFLRVHAVTLFVVCFAMAITLAIRVRFFGFRSGDLDGFVLVWCNDIQKLGVAGALKQSSINYNPPYLYLLWLITKLPLSRVLLVKLASVVGDYVCAAALAGIVYRIYPSAVRAGIAAFALLVVPTVIFNGALWGQCDMLYTAALVLALAARFYGRRSLAAALFGLALSLKLQAIFLFPLLGVWVLRKEIPLRSLVLTPVTFVLTLVPAWLAGTPFADLIAIYPKQIHNSGGLSFGAPTLFTWLPNDERWLAGFGLWFAAAATFMVVLACLYSRERTSPILIIKQATLFACLVPFLLPHMHERYIFLGDVLAVLYVFVLPRHFWVALLVIGASFVSYFSFLFGKDPVPIPLAACLLGAACVFLLSDLLRSLYPGAFAGPGRPLAGRSLG
jgi:Gpi18-like mannosyltransferase